MAEKIITIIGGTGFVGRQLVKVLAGAGYRLRIVCRHPNTPEAVELKTAGNLGQIAVGYGDITRPETLSIYLDDAHTVINLTGILYQKGTQRFNAVHAKGAEQLAQMAAKSNVRTLIHLSALGVDKATTSTYARTKILGERAVKAAFPDVIILRPSVIFGAQDNFYNQFAAMASISPALPLIGGGQTKFQPVYVGDVAHAILYCMEHPETAGNIYELGGPSIYSFEEIMAYILKITGQKACLCNIPTSLASAGAMFAEWLPTPPLTRDQVRLLQYDNVVSPTSPGLEDLKIKPTAVEAIVPEYLHRYRRPDISNVA